MFRGSRRKPPAGVVELLGERDLLGVRPGPASARPSASARGSESVAGVGEDQLALRPLRRLARRVALGSSRSLAQALPETVADLEERKIDSDR